MVLQESAEGNWVTTSAPRPQGAPLHGTWSQETGSARLKMSTHEEGCTRRRTASLAALRLPHSPGLGALTAGHAHIIQAPRPRDSIRAEGRFCSIPCFLPSVLSLLTMLFTFLAPLLTMLNASQVPREVPEFFVGSISKIQRKLSKGNLRGKQGLPVERKHMFLNE